MIKRSTRVYALALVAVFLASCSGTTTSLPTSPSSPSQQNASAANVAVPHVSDYCSQASTEDQRSSPRGTAPDCDATLKEIEQLAASQSPKEHAPAILDPVAKDYGAPATRDLVSRIARLHHPGLVAQIAKNQNRFSVINVRGTQDPSAGIRPMSQIEGVCAYLVTITTWTFTFTSASGSSWSYSWSAITDRTPLYCSDGYGAGDGQVIAYQGDWLGNGCAQLTASAASSTNISAAGQTPKTLNDLIMGDAALNNLATFLYLNNALPGNVSISPTSTDGTDAAINTLFGNPPGSTLNWYTDTLNGDNFDQTQVLFQELDHQYWSLFGLTPNLDLSNTTPDIETVTFGGQTYQFNINPVQPDGTVDWTQQQGYQHFQIYNDVMAMYGHDDAGLLNEALQAAQNAPTGSALATALSHNGQTATLSKPGTTRTTTGLNCNGILSSVGRRPASLRVISPELSSELFKEHK